MEWIEADWPAPPWVRALATTRLGGLSEGVYAGLNLGDHVGDDPERVAANRARLCQALNLPAEPRWLRQVHGCEVLALGGPGQPQGSGNTLTLVTVQTPSPQPSPAGGEGARASASCTAEALLGHEESEQIPTVIRSDISLIHDIPPESGIPSGIYPDPGIPSGIPSDVDIGPDSGIPSELLNEPGEVLQTQPCEADAAVAWGPGQVCAVLTADCLPLLLTDRAGTRVAAVHAGWRGLAAGVIEAAVARLAVPPADLLAWLGPAIGPGAFEVGDEVREVFVAQDQAAAAAFSPLTAGPGQGTKLAPRLTKDLPNGRDRSLLARQTPCQGRDGAGLKEGPSGPSNESSPAPYTEHATEPFPGPSPEQATEPFPIASPEHATEPFPKASPEHAPVPAPASGFGAGKWRADLYMLARLRLARLGVTGVWGGGLCTYEDARRFYSYRRDGVTGRMASLIWIDPGWRNG